MIRAHINDRWELFLPEHRAEFHASRPWWEAARLNDMAAYISNGTRLLDVGSEEGDLTALYASWGARVTFIDPSLAWINQTRHIFKANGFRDNGWFCGLAASATDFSKPMGKDPRFHTLEEDIRRVSIDDAFDIEWDAITMDVEGAELEVLQGAKRTLLETSPTVWVSIHGDVDVHAKTPSKVHELMRSLGYWDQFLAYDHEFHYRFWR